jgi:hypothetical protein
MNRKQDILFIATILEHVSKELSHIGGSRENLPIGMAEAEYAIEKQIQFLTGHARDGALVLRRCFARLSGANRTDADCVLDAGNWLGLAEYYRDEAAAAEDMARLARSAE